MQLKIVILDLGVESGMSKKGAIGTQVDSGSLSCLFNLNVS